MHPISMLEIKTFYIVRHEIFKDKKAAQKYAKEVAHHVSEQQLEIAYNPEDGDYNISNHIPMDDNKEIPF